MINLPLGTLITFGSRGDTYTGFIIGRCCYDGLLEDVDQEFNAYVVRYTVKKDDEVPKKPYTIVDRNIVEPITEYPEDFSVMGHWSATPKDRVVEWVLEEWFIADGMRLLRVVPKKETIEESRTQ